MNLKVLNLYPGIGGNRKLWVGVDVTAVEIDPVIAGIYQDFYPKDNVITADAHQYLLDHYNEGWDFIWSSPPCPTHSDIRRLGVEIGTMEPLYPDMQLYQEIIFLRRFFHGIYCVENVRSYYEPLIIPQVIGRHYFWANFVIGEHKDNTPHLIKYGTITSLQKLHDINLSSYKIKNKRKILRNCVKPNLGQHIFNCAFKVKQTTFEGGNL